MNFSKSKYFSFWQCPKKLWLETYKASEREPDDPSTLARMESGTEVGRLAHQLFPQVIDITTRRPDGSLDLQAMVARTQQEMAAGTPVIAEAAFLHDGCYCAVDMLERTADGWAIHEVKSSCYPETEDKKFELKKYAPDIAFQKWVLTQCGVNVTGTFLRCLNATYVRHGALDVLQLFVNIDMHEMVEEELLKVPANVATAKRMLSDSENVPAIDLSGNCNKPYPCPFLTYCKRQQGVPADKPTVFDLYRMSMGKKTEHFNAGRVTFEDMRGEKLNDTQRLQLECTLNHTEHIDRDDIRRFLDTLRYPLYFLDFETMQFALPQYDDSKPYQQITFQYSLHVVKDPNTVCDKQGYGYLAESDGRDPRRKLAEDLCDHIPFGACTIVYNDTFEKSRLKEMAEIYPDLRDHLLSIRDGICDLLVPFREGHYYLPSMGGSFSIKSVLPALFPNDPDLDYHNLPGCVKNGGEAMTIFPLIQTMPKAEANAARQSLVEYCNLDTWAMVKVWDKLMHV